MRYFEGLTTTQVPASQYSINLLVTNDNASGWLEYTAQTGFKYDPDFHVKVPDVPWIQIKDVIYDEITLSVTLTFDRCLTTKRTTYISVMEDDGSDVTNNITQWGLYYAAWSPQEMELTKSNWKFNIYNLQKELVYSGSLYHPTDLTAKINFGDIFNKLISRPILGVDSPVPTPLNETDIFTVTNEQGSTLLSVPRIYNYSYSISGTVQAATTLSNPITNKVSMSYMPSITGYNVNGNYKVELIAGTDRPEENIYAGDIVETHISEPTQTTLYSVVTNYLINFDSDVYPGDKFKIYINNESQPRFIKNVTCSEWDLYYLNPLGGYDTFCIEGNVVETANFDKTYFRSNNYAQEYLISETRRGEQDITSKITKTYKMTTGWLTDLESSRFLEELLTSTDVYVNHFYTLTPVRIILDNVTKQQFKNGRLLNQYTITVSESNYKLIR